MTDDERSLLRSLADAHKRGSFAQACDGRDRASAHALEARGYARWVGTTWGSSFWQITDTGLGAGRAQ